MATKKLSNGCGYLDCYKSKPVSHDLTIVCAPMTVGAERNPPETDCAPPHLLKHLEKKLGGCGFTIAEVVEIDCTPKGDPSGDNEVNNKADVLRISADIAKAVEQQALQRRIIIVLGGDHGIHMGTTAGLSAACKKLHGNDADIGQCTLDAHLDLQKLSTSPSGNAHGMTNSANLGFMDDKDFNNIHEDGPKLQGKNVLIIGVNDPDPDEIGYVKKSGIDVVTMQEITLKGLQGTVRKIDSLRQRIRMLLYDIDLDGMTTATPMPNYFGLTRQQALALSMHVGTNPDQGAPVGVIQIAEYSPQRDEGNKTASLVAQMVATALGARPSPTIYETNGNLPLHVIPSVS